MVDAYDAYKSALTDEYGYITVGYHTFTAGQVLEKCLGSKEFNKLVESYALLKQGED